jgi:hypothetical protein
LLSTTTARTFVGFLFFLPFGGMILYAFKNVTNGI